MKNLFSTLLFVLIVGSSFAQITNEQFTVITKVSADWCPNCGGWAWPVFEDMRTEFEDKNAIFVLAHRDGNLQNDVSLPWCLNLDFQYQPEFFLNNDEQSMNTNSAPAAIESMGEQIDFLSSLGAFAGVEGQGYIVNNSDQLYADVDVEFFSEVAGEYYLGVYTIQTNIIANQSGQGTVLQPKLLTGGFTEDWFGIPISSSTGIQSFEFSMDQPADFSAVEGDTEILSVIWNKVGDQYVFFNANMNEIILSVSSTNELKNSIASMKANFSNDQLNVNIDATESLNNGKVVLTNLTGQTLFNADVAELNTGLNQLNYLVNNLNSGIYILSLQIGDKQVSQKIFK